jgi:hypothetical protein
MPMDLSIEGTVQWLFFSGTMSTLPKMTLAHLHVPRDKHTTGSSHCGLVSCHLSLDAQWAALSQHRQKQALASCQLAAKHLPCL